MQGHRLTARSERNFQDNVQSPSNTLLAVKKVPSVHDDSDGDEICNAGNTAADGGAHVDSGSGTSYRLLDATAGVDPQVVYRNLWLFIWLKTIGSFDSGAFSAALGAECGIGNSWELNMKHQGVLTSSVFLGNVVGCPLAGHLFSRYNEKRVLCCSLLVHAVFTFLFAAMPTYDVALINRFFIGLSLSFIVVYTPVWVDEFAPKNRQSVWMASHNAGVPLGIMLGYLLAVGPQMLFASIGWNWAFFMKCLVMVPTITYVARVDSRTINTTKLTGNDGKGGNAAASAAVATVVVEEGRPTTSPTEDAVLRVHANTLPGARNQASRALHTSLGDLPCSFLTCCRHVAVGFYSLIVPLFRNIVYLCSVVSLTSLYFVATGLQNFVTQYLQEPPFSASMTTIMIGFGSAVVTAPVCGVIAGGILLDRIGGYKRNLRRVTYFLFAWGGCAVLFSIICIFAQTTRGFLLVMSVVLFCGGALIPPGAGLTMASLPDHLRSAGAAFSQTIYNLLGNFSGPLVCGWVADTTGQLRYGIITLLLSSALGVLPLFGILYVACRGSLLPNELGDNGGNLADGLSDGDAVMRGEEDTFEMDSVDGEATVEREELHLLAAQPMVPTLPSPTQQQQQQEQQRQQGEGTQS